MAAQPLGRRRSKLEPGERAESPLVETILRETEDLFEERKRLVMELKTANERLADILETMPAAFVAFDREFRFTFANSRAEQLLHHSRDELMGKVAWDLFPESLGSSFQTLGVRAMRERRAITHEDYYDHFDAWLEISMYPTPEGLCAYFRDVTEKKRAEERIRQAEARYRRLVEQIPVVTYMHAVDELGSPIYMSPQVEEILGYTAEEFEQDKRLWTKALHPEDRESVLLENERTNATAEPFTLEYRMIHREGRVVWIRDEALLVQDEEGRRLWQGVLLDITERKQAEEQIAFLAYHDKLTRLPNRAKFAELLDLSLTRARRSGSAVAVLYMDIDNFKLVNDSLGHAAGDELLRQVAARLNKVARDTDVVARQGGDEFLLMLSDIELDPLGGTGEALEVADTVANRVHEALRACFAVGQTECYVTVSIGISIFPLDASDGETLLRNADSAMYKSKRTAPGGHLLYASDASDPLLRLSFSTRLRLAIERQHWVMHYQPIMDLTDGRMVAVEALLRWRDPDSGELIYPGEFVELAEEMGLSEPMGEWVLQEVCRQSRQWQDEGLDIRTTFNLSPRQLWRPGLAERLAAQISEAGIEPARIIAEVTESTAMTEPERTQRALWDLHERGVELAIDDFGTGYSSLSRLKHLPIGILKIDRTFVRDLPNDKDAASIVAAIIQLAQTLGMAPLAEGIETQEQWRFLVGRGCALGQGFHFSPPVAPNRISVLYGVR